MTRPDADNSIERGPLTAFQVAITTDAPPEFVARWWTDYREDDTKLSDDLRVRTVDRKDPQHLRITSELVVAGRPVRIEGTVSILSPTAWSMDGTLFVRGRPFGREQVEFTVEPASGGSVLVAHFQFKGRNALNGLILWVIHRSIRAGREKAYREYARHINEDFAAQRGKAG